MAAAAAAVAAAVAQPRDEIKERCDRGPRPQAYPHPGANAADWGDVSGPLPSPLKDDFAIKWNARQQEPSEATGLKEHLPDANALCRYRPVIIVDYMRKGGVGKSSTTSALAHALAKLGRTMTVDCDSQQDLTELTFRAAAEQAGTDVDDYLQQQLPKDNRGRNERTCASLADAVRFVLDISRTGETRPRTVPDWACDNLLLKPYPFPAQCVTTDAEGNRAIENVHNLFHVQGGSEFEEMETKLAHFMTGFGTADPKRNAPGSLWHAIWNAGYECKADFVVIDLSPALGQTNQVLLTHCDYFVMPCEVNKLSEKNLRKFATTMKDWYREYQQDGANGVFATGFRQVSRGIRNRSGDPSAECPLPEMEPKFAGLIMNKYDQRVKSKKRDVDGNDVDTTEQFKSASRVTGASRLLHAARQLRNELSRATPAPTPANPHPKQSAILAVQEGSFPSQPPAGSGYTPASHQFKHPAQTNFCPQPLLLGRVAKATALFEAAPACTGKPMSQLTCDDIKHARKHDGNGLFEFLPKNSDGKAEAMEDIAHQRRIFQDIAKFLHDEAGTKQPFNFVFDPTSEDAVATRNQFRKLKNYGVPGNPEFPANCTNETFTQPHCSAGIVHPDL